MKHDHGRLAQFRAREADRVRIDLEACLTLEGNVRQIVTVTDLSTSGFCCQCPELILIGAAVVLHIPEAGDFPATVVWQLGQNTGIRFDPPLSVSRVMSIILGAVRQGSFDIELAVRNHDGGRTG